MAEDIKNIFTNLDSLLASTKIDDVTSERSNSFKELPDGYYLCSVNKAEIKESKSSGNPMVAITFLIEEDGKQLITDDDNNASFENIPNTKKQKIMKYYVLKDESSVKRFVSDMLKFEGEEIGKPLLEKEYFTNSEVLADALDILVYSKIYVQLTTNTKEDGTKSTWENLVSWKRATLLGLGE